jgi:hypothetical protein
MGASSLDPSFEALVQRLAVIPLHQEKGHRGLRGPDALKARDWHAFLIAPTAIQVIQKEISDFSEMSFLKSLRKK